MCNLFDYLFGISTNIVYAYNKYISPNLISINEYICASVLVAGVFQEDMLHH